MHLFINFKARALYGKAKESKDYEEALSNFEYYLEENPTDFYTLIYKASCLVSLNRTNEAISVYEGLMNEHNREEVIAEIIKTYEQSGRVEEAIKYAGDYLKEHNSWRVKYSLAITIVKRAKTMEELEQVKGLLEDCYMETGNEIVAESIVQLYRKMGLDKENYEFLERLVTVSKDGRFAYIGNDFVEAESSFVPSTTAPGLNLQDPFSSSTTTFYPPACFHF